MGCTREQALEKLRTAILPRRMFQFPDDGDALLGTVSDGGFRALARYGSGRRTTFVRVIGRLVQREDGVWVRIRLTQDSLTLAFVLAWVGFLLALVVKGIAKRPQSGAGWSVVDVAGACGMIALCYFAFTLSFRQVANRQRAKLIELFSGDCPT